LSHELLSITPEQKAVDLRLLDLASILASELPAMGVQKIHDLMRDPSYSSIIVSSDKSVVMGGCTFKYQQEVLELVLLGILQCY
jgi:hypothetical protein